MSTETQVRQAVNVQTAMLFMAQALDRIEAQLAARPANEPADGWGSWPAPTAHDLSAWPTHGQSSGVSVTVGEDTSEVQVPKVSDERLQQRQKFAQWELKLDAYAKGEKNWDDKPTNYESWAHVYAHGGPAWLYHANRDFVMLQPERIRRALVEDLIQDDPNAAHEMARDILKKDAETAPGNGVGPDPGF